MPKYYKKAPFLIRWIYSKATWRVKTSDKILYLTFDDGPTEGVTNFVLEELAKYNAKATFFCLGHNSVNNPKLMDELVANGHAIGNHSYSHPNGFRTKIGEYIDDVKKADVVVLSKLFRPPYGKMKLRQYKYLKKFYRIIMWDVMPGDFDANIDGDKCFTNVVSNARKGSIIVFHDSEKAVDRLRITLPRVLKYYSDLGYRFEKLI